jgi:hypothetical protein
MPYHLTLQKAIGLILMVINIYLTPCIPLSFKGEGEDFF